MTDSTGRGAKVEALLMEVIRGSDVIWEEEDGNDWDVELGLDSNGTLVLLDSPEPDQGLLQDRYL